MMRKFCFSVSILLLLFIFINGLTLYVDDTSYSDFFKQNLEMQYSNVRNDADVIITIGEELNSGGGYTYSLFLFGNNQYEGINDTISLDTEPGMSEAELREHLLKMMKLGLVKYMIADGETDNISIEYSRRNIIEENMNDPWNNWYMKIAGSGQFYGEQSYTRRLLYGVVNATRVTENNKMSLSVSGEFDYSEFVMDSLSSIIMKKPTYSFNSYFANGINEHWTYGAYVKYYHSTYYNWQHIYEVMPAVEYNFFPYNESSSRQLTIMYRPFAGYYQYIEQTIFGKTEEIMTGQEFIIAADYIQKWGSAEVSLSYSHQFADLSKYDLYLNGYLDFYLLKGLSLSLYMYFLLPRNQFYLPAEGASQEEILLEQRKLQTDYEYNISVFITYTFGTRNRSIVNSRFNI